MPLRTGKLKAIIFDFGGVLVRTRSQRRRAAWEQRFGLLPGGAEELVFGSESSRAAQHGRITDVEHWRWIGAQLQVDAATLSEFQTDFFAEDYLDAALIAYIDRLRAAGYHLGLLSNASDNARWVFTELFPVLGHFDSVTISCEEGWMKPDPRIFRAALQRAGAEPDEAVFVDDMLANVEGARALGMLGIHFRDPAGVLHELSELTGVSLA